jgi:cytochrome c peroxidase
MLQKKLGLLIYIIKNRNIGLLQQKNCAHDKVIGLWKRQADIFFKSLTLVLYVFGCQSAFAGDARLGLPPLTIPNDNPQTPEKIALGKRLFNDKRFSKNGTISCASCHRPELAFADGLAHAKGIDNQVGVRNTPSILNAAFYDTFFLDGRAQSLEKQALGPLMNPIEHGLTGIQDVVTLVKNDPAYTSALTKVFNVNPEQITVDHVSQAIASYERTLIAGNSPFDRYLYGKDKSAMSENAIRGLAVFRRKGNCITCHEISWQSALFTDNRFYNIGVGFRHIEPLLKELEDGQSSTQLALTDAQRSELGHYQVTLNKVDLGRFKTPTLRNVALTAPYMHDGSLATLADVVEHYDKGGDGNGYSDDKIFPLHLTVREKADLVEFMQALTSEGK